MDRVDRLLAVLPLGGWELVVIALVGLIVIFGKRLPELGRSLGRSITEFRKGLSGQDQPKPPSGSGQGSDSDEAGPH